MKNLFQFLSKLIFYCSIIFIGITLFSLTIGQYLNYEFACNKVSSCFYYIITRGLPIAILLTLFGTIKSKSESAAKLTIAVLTISAAVFAFFIIISMLFSVDFITIKNEAILYRQKENPTITITQQSIAQGALGTNGHRIVRLEPFLKWWNKVTLVDTFRLNKNEWNIETKKSSSLNSTNSNMPLVGF